MRSRDSSNSDFHRILGHPLPSERRRANKRPCCWRHHFWDPEHLPSSLEVLLRCYATHSILYFCSALQLKSQSIYGFVLSIVYSLHISVQWEWEED